MTLKEVISILQTEFEGAGINVELYIDFPKDDNLFDELGSCAVFKTTINYGKTLLRQEDYLTMIDMALAMGDKEWFDELTNTYKIISKNY